MRVLFITRDWSPAVGAMETYSIEFTGELSRMRRLRVRRLPGRADGRTPSMLSPAHRTVLSVLAPAGDAGEAGRWEPHMSDVDGAALGGRRR